MIPYKYRMTTLKMIKYIVIIYSLKSSGIIKAGKFEPVRLPFLGKFHVRKGRLNYLQKNEGPNNS